MGEREVLAIPQAVEVAELHDRMHLKTTYYNLAKSSEALGEVQAAINRSVIDLAQYNIVGY